jgi:predicted Zn-dependent protease
MTGNFPPRIWLAISLLLSAPVISGANNDEEMVGQAAAATILGAAPLVDSVPAQRYLNAVGGSVAANVKAGHRWRFGVVKSEGVNAFAAPAGFILVSRGLIDLLESEDELAFVLAHEVAHVMRKHHYNVVQRQRLVEKAAKDLQELEQSDLVGKLSSLSGQMYARGLDKAAEFEADRLGVELMTRAGYDPAAAISVLEKLMTLQGNDPRAELLFSTHPSPANRLEQLAATGIEKLPRPKSPNPAAEKRFKDFKKQLPA